MSPIPGIVASQISGHLASPSSYESIATVTLGSSASNISFSSIPSTYKHLQIRAYHKGTTAEWVKLAINSDSTGANYNQHRILGDGTSASTEYENSNNIFTLYNYWGSTIIDISDYTNTNKNRVLRTISGWDNNGSGEVRFSSTLWRNTAALSAISFTSANFVTGTNFALYGIKG